MGYCQISNDAIKIEGDESFHCSGQMTHVLSALLVHSRVSSVALMTEKVRRRYYVMRYPPEVTSSLRAPIDSYVTRSAIGLHSSVLARVARCLRTVGDTGFFFAHGWHRGIECKFYQFLENQQD